MYRRLRRTGGILLLLWIATPGGWVVFPSGGAAERPATESPPAIESLLKPPIHSRVVRDREALAYAKLEGEPPAHRQIKNHGGFPQGKSREQRYAIVGSRDRTPESRG
jgi:hypothetical protein